MPVWLAVTPRQKLPPPTTTATSTRSLAALICSAMLRTVVGSMPKAAGPIRASPLTFSRMRLYGAFADLLPKFVTSEAAHTDIFACRRDGFFHELFHRPGAVLDEGLLHQHGFLVRTIGSGRQLIFGDRDGGR